jgi:hypothetical protein
MSAGNALRRYADAMSDDQELPGSTASATGGKRRSCAMASSSPVTGCSR